MKIAAIVPFVAALGLAAVPAMARKIEYVEVKSPPPLSQAETAPAAPAGQVWIPGTYEYWGNQYVWVPGRLEPARAEGFVYVPPRYEDGKYYVARWDEDVKVKRTSGAAPRSRAAPRVRTAG